MAHNRTRYTHGVDTLKLLRGTLYYPVGPLRAWGEAWGEYAGEAKGESGGEYDGEAKGESGGEYDGEAGSDNNARSTGPCPRLVWGKSWRAGGT